MQWRGLLTLAIVLYVIDCCGIFTSLQPADFNNQLFTLLRSIYNKECVRFERVDPLLATIDLVTRNPLATIPLPLQMAIL